ncbi:MAG: hypothetical protein JOZ47_09390 [Kutzneria sp.]|nr:hypothetical protein [Kutzneria sp.]
MASVEQVHTALNQVQDHLRTAYQQVSHAQQRLNEAVAILTAASRLHPRSLVPPELSRACEHIGEQLSLITSGMEAVERFAGRL